MVTIIVNKRRTKVPERVAVRAAHIVTMAFPWERSAVGYHVGYAWGGRIGVLLGDEQTIPAEDMSFTVTKIG